MCLAQLLFYFEPDSTMPDWQAWLYATGVVLGSAVYVFTHHPYFFGVQHVGMKMRVAACSLIYQKVGAGLRFILLRASSTRLSIFCAGTLRLFSSRVSLFLFTRFVSFSCITSFVAFREFILYIY